LVLGPGLRFQFFASLSTIVLEPRFGMKFNATPGLRFKAAGGLYSQNLIAAVSEQDVVNLFVGFLSAPDRLFEPNSTTRTANRIQQSVHAIGGVEIDLARNLELNVEPYYKYFPQLININRDKIDPEEPDFQTETGRAWGIEFLLKYDTKRWFIWTAYSLGYVRRDDGVQEYPTNFDRRHNLNFVLSYTLGRAGTWEASARWNMGSGFPFTLTQGFYQDFNFEDGIGTDYITGNGDLGVIYSEELNGGRLPFYHRLDLSLKKTFEFTRNTKLEIYSSVTNVYDRENIFFFDRIDFERVNQLPILPSLGFTLHL